MRRSVVLAGSLRVPGTRLPKGALFWLLQCTAWWPLAAPC